MGISDGINSDLVLEEATLEKNNVFHQKNLPFLSYSTSTNLLFFNIFFLLSTI